MLDGLAVFNKFGMYIKNSLTGRLADQENHSLVRLKFTNPVKSVEGLIA